MNGDFDPLRVLRVFLAHGVQFIVIGGIAGRAWGSPTITNDLDVCYERSAANCAALAEALRELKATLRGAPAGIPFQLDARSIRMGDSFTFETDAGPVDCLGTPAGTMGYPDLLKSSSAVDFDSDLRVSICSLDDLMRMKRTAGRAKDRVELEILAAVKEERERT